MNHNFDKDKEKLAEYALGALDEFEARDFEARLAADSALAAESEDWRETAAALSYAAEAVEPSSDVRARILEKIKNTPQISGGDLNPKDGSGAQKFASPAAVSNVVPFPPRQPSRTFLSYLPAAGAIAASIVALVLAFSLYRALENNESKDSQLAALNQKLTQSEQRLNDFQAQLERERQDRELLGSPDSIVASLNGTENVPQARARLIFDKQTGRTMLFVENLPDAPKGKVYQVWFISDPKKPFPGGVFAPNAAGKAVIHDEMPAESLKASAFAVTLEPEGGSAAPTSKPLLTGSPL